MKTFSFKEMVRRTIRAEGQSRTAKTVEVFGWLIFFEGPLFLLCPQFVVSLLQLPPLPEQGPDYFRLLGVFVCAVGLFYIVCGRLNAEGFLFVSMLDRPLVPLVMAVLWHFGIVTGAFALVFSIQDFGSFLWTLFTWRSESRTP